MHPETNVDFNPPRVISLTAFRMRSRPDDEQPPPLRPAAGAHRPPSPVNTEAIAGVGMASGLAVVAA